MHIIETTHELAEAVDATIIVTGSQEEAMEPLSKEDIVEHEIGLYVAPWLSTATPAFGYVACKRLFAPEALSPYQAAGRDALPQTYALVGGLYLHRSLRGQGIAQQLVQLVSDLTFERYPDVSGCVALCNKVSQKVFALADYQSLGKSQQLVPPKEGKVPLLARRDRWDWYKKYRDATIGGEHGYN